MSQKPIFFDPTGKRAQRMRRTRRVLLSTTAVILVSFVVYLLVISTPSHADLSGRAAALFNLPMGGASFDKVAPRTSQRVAAELRAREREMGREKNAARIHETRGKPAPAWLAPTPGRALSMGFYANWDDNSLPSLKRALPHLDWVIPAWLNLQGPDMAMHSELNTLAVEAIKQIKPGIPVLPMIQNSVEGSWDGAGLERFLADPVKRATRLKEIVTFLQTNKMQGLTIDFETVPPAAQKNLLTFLGEISAEFDKHNWALLVCVPFDDPAWNYKAVADVADFVVLMAYDQHWEEGTPGSIAGQDWFESLLDKRMKELDPEQTIIAIGNYGYNWANGKPADDLTFQEAIQAAQDSEADIDFDEDAENPHFTYTEAGVKHDVWFLDAVTSFNQIHAADIYKPFGYALWRLGSEDPSIWSVMGRPYNAAVLDGLRTIGGGHDVDFQGQGEILRVASTPSEGQRTLEIDPQTGDVVDQNYTTMPMAYTIQRFGAVPKKIALTFDDGPDPIWTPKILDVLKQKGVRASFFIIGENAGSNPDLVRREVAEHHDVGNHTFTHPNLSILPESLVKLELDTTRKLFESITNRSMRLVRPPYLGDADPTTYDQIEPVRIAQSMGFITVGLRIDPDDWQQPGVQAIIDTTLKEIESTDEDVTGHIVLLHDSGGDRSQTVAALPILIDTLRAKGYELVPVSELAGLTPDQVMPPLPAGSVLQKFAAPVFLALGQIGSVTHLLFLVAIALGLARVAFLCILGLIHKWRELRLVRPVLSADPPLLSVLIPAHNEAKVIVASIHRILSSDYPKLEVIVIDDGSADETSALVNENFSANKSVTLITVPNGGKAKALNIGLKKASGSIVVALDADTQFETETISYLARWFVDEKVGAVAGNAKVGNRVNTITNWQALEYVSAQNLERRALDLLGCITVVPGAVGAWRRSLLDELGGYPDNTLAEDQDLTIAVQKARYKVLYDSEAIAWTEAPDTVQGLVKQRFRWAFGTLQCLWKHRDALFARRYGTLGFIALPQVVLFQIVLAVISPLLDLCLFFQIFKTGLDYIQHRDQFDPSNLYLTTIYFIAFMALDTATVAIAFAMEKREEWGLLLLVALQRFGYRQILYYVVLKSIFSAGAGALVGWGKLERKGTVTSPEPSKLE
ncbi:polysaccharide deacetylase family protein [Stenotrophobium rhamnosiphilum]|uniref:Polysaccharide deacetylase n=1 Tax=Stenotrophobium rhamnosiphilum TaxID=2029166 RepID=A0A2T5MED7_9GAMM|nr:glycosyltransferase [Stenotrophobium rhamnosiphilum]PTU30945.1 polysaccharide deacetylase [Stenotrophobium rhamnosiphilum]